MVIREATVADLDTIMHHRRGMFTDMGYLDETDLKAMEATSAPVIKAGLQDGSYRGWLIEQDGKVIAGGGLVIVTHPSAPNNPMPRRAWILSMYTEPEYRCRGYAKAIIETIVARCRSEGYVYVSLHASDAGRHLYETMGFKPTNEMRLALT
jgi:GNAT superfamily N-acetyltransferase